MRLAVACIKYHPIITNLWAFVAAPFALCLDWCHAVVAWMHNSADYEHLTCDAMQKLNILVNVYNKFFGKDQSVVDYEYLQQCFVMRAAYYILGPSII